MCAEPMSVDVGSEARVAQPRKLRRFGWRVGGPRLPQTYIFITDSSQSLSPFEKTLCTFTRNARPPSAQLKSTQTRPAASVNCHLCSTMTCFGWPRWLRGRGPSPRDPIRAHQAVSAPAKNHGLFWRRHISSGVDQRWSLTPRATPSSRSDCAVYCRSSLMPSSP